MITIAELSRKDRSRRIYWYALLHPGYLIKSVSKRIALLKGIAHSKPKKKKKKRGRKSVLREQGKARVIHPALGKKKMGGEEIHNNGKKKKERKNSSKWLKKDPRSQKERAIADPGVNY